MAIFTPSSQPTGVGPAGTVVSVAIPSGYRQRRLARIVVQNMGGSLHFWSACFSTDPTVGDPLAEITCWDNQLPGTKLDDDHLGTGFTWNGAETHDWSTASKNVYVRLKVDTGTDNSFVVGIHVDDL